MWLLVFEDTENGDNGQSIWDDITAARRQAVSEILDDIRDRWDLSDPDVEQTARNINDLASVGDYQATIDAYNDAEADNSYGGHYWSVIERDVCTLSDVSPIIPILFADDEEEEEEEEDEEEEDDGTPYQATDPGATCRGPCGQYNEYAYADKRDGTHLCRQCKTFGHIFGTNP